MRNGSFTHYLHDAGLISAVYAHVYLAEVPKIYEVIAKENSENISFYRKVVRYFERSTRQVLIHLLFIFENVQNWHFSKIVSRQNEAH